jgi:hypothetical protein
VALVLAALSISRWSRPAVRLVDDHEIRRGT